jgi:hypothetical protein
MAFFFTFAIECYRDEDAVRIGERLQRCTLSIGTQGVSMSRVDVFARGDYWYIFAFPQGPGYSEFGNDAALNKPESTAAIIEQLYEIIATEPGMRRALCGYEAQDIFDLYGEPELVQFGTPNLVYDRKASIRGPNAQEWGSDYYRNL